MGEFHGNGLVHGDLRDVNLIIPAGKPGRIMLIDYDWGGKHGDVSFSTTVTASNCNSTPLVYLFAFTYVFLQKVPSAVCNKLKVVALKSKCRMAFPIVLTSNEGSVLQSSDRSPETFSSLHNLLLGSGG